MRGGVVYSRSLQTMLLACCVFVATTILLPSASAADEENAVTTTITCGISYIPPLDPENVAVIEQSIAGATILPLEPIGAKVYGMDLRQTKRPNNVTLHALEAEMANRGFLVFKNQHNLTPDELIQASVWWGGHELHSVHGIHPATPNKNPHIFRVSNDNQQGIKGVGATWHNDGSFETAPFSHVGYHMIQVPEHGGSTHFAHQGAAYDALSPETQDYWSRLSSVNANSGVVHPMVHVHPISKRKSVWLHLGLTGAVVEKIPEHVDVEEVLEGFRLLDKWELKQLLREYNALLTAGMNNGYAMAYHYEEGDLIFIDNWAVAHRASPEAHRPVNEQGLRILHRTTIKAPLEEFPSFHDDLPQYMDIHGPNPFPNSKEEGGGVWSGYGMGFRWEEEEEQKKKVGGLPFLQN